MPRTRRPRDVRDAERAAGDLLLVAHDEEDQHVEAERGEREVVVLHAQRRKAEREPDREARDGGDRQHDEERPAGLQRDRRDVGADAEERRLAERHLARVADGEVEAERRHQVDAAQRHQVDVAALEDRSASAGERGERRRPATTVLRSRSLHTLRSSDLPSRPSGRNRITSRNSTSATPSLYAGET